MYQVEQNTFTSLAAPARYLPWLRQRDLLAPGLYRFGHDFGNGYADQQFFQLDNEYSRYRENSLQARQQLSSYYCYEQRPPKTEQAVNNFIIRQVCKEHPQWFSQKNDALHCKLTGEVIQRRKPGNYTDLFDALASQLQEDIAVMQFEKHGGQRLCALHLCCPNHWGANQRLGESFAQLHKPVPGLNESMTGADKLLPSLLHRGPFVRFAWGLTNSRTLDLHPDKTGTNRRLQASSKMYARVERQVLYGMPEVNCLLFIIRTSFLAVDGLSSIERASLWQQIENSNNELLRYKGLQDCKQHHFK